MLLKRFQHEFDAYSRSEGKSCFRRQAVKLIQSGSGIYHLTVQGSERSPYDVYFDFRRVDQGGDVDVNCSCPRYADGDLCKHLWAALHVVESRGTERPAGTGPLSLLWTETEEASGFEEALNGDNLAQGGELAVLEQLLAQAKAKEIMVAGGSTRTATTTPELIITQSMQAPAVPTIPTIPTPPPAPPWMADLRGISVSRPRRIHTFQKSDTQLWYAINVTRSVQEDTVAVDLFIRQLLPDGQWAAPRRVAHRDEIQATISSRVEQEFLTHCWSGTQDSFTPSWYRQPVRRGPEHQLSLDPQDAEVYFPRLALTGRLTWLFRGDQPWDAATTLSWDAVPYQFELIADRSAEVGGWKVSGQLSHINGSWTQPLSNVVMTNSCMVLFHDRIGMLANDDDQSWVGKLAPRPWVVTDDQRFDFLQYLSEATPPTTRFPDEFCKAATIDPVAVLSVDLSTVGKKQEVSAKLAYLYGEARVRSGMSSSMAFDKLNGVLYSRNLVREQAFVRQANHTLKLSPGVYWTGQTPLRIPIADFPEITQRVAAAGWIVEANNERLRTGGKLSLSVASNSPSNIDWFDLSGKIEFEGGWATTLPKLLDAIRHGHSTIRLDDGSIGLMPEDWIKRFGRMAELGDAKDGKLRFQSSQALLLDALLSSDQTANVDLGFKEVRERLQKTHKVKSLPSPKGFGGELRDYQKHGQGWLSCLHDLKLGGCLADDMGLGKTVQVLSWLETLRQKNAKAKNVDKRPSLVVVPKSLVFNWVAEAAKFTPKMRVLNFTGKERVGLEDLAEIDLVVTTYGTMRNDIERLREIDFEYLILDEAQAIKNSNAQAAKAARLLKGRHRLAMSGTPIENHLGELWSLFEFINPGLLGNSTAFQRVARSSASEPESLQWLSKAIAPFVLRRTKGQVLTELPEKSEQIIYCDMSPKHRKLYNELRDHYRASLTQTVHEKGLEKSKIHVLEALLRLRQAACHPGLLNATLKKEPGPKLEELIERLREITAEGHKALVFSQFTSFLAILQDHLKKEKLPFLYLDGQTSLKDRQSRVEKFQSDDKTPLFLISLKAGGSGLNLTAADYVFLLDPWWNPAVETQAIDRTHRIGQTRKVHACRLITRETVEEKVLELQKSKKNLAEAILSIDGSLLRKLSWEDLQMLFA